ncbi:methylated-DNA--[protein]-cysteine S-methyltransferase [Thiocapsa roseopersicina]|uniref:methylated-DNA--[protein]-cysteine S-methyltransferase n=1 Tax=Thiocapsa roseopersicina TaxID=1058 RepID=A0A1H2T2W7_THIRO|nr:methylated-DNA--[protein]-cysteine S-methyltransferase [Thiocapsa roseopersicina]SDW37639.1 methylated-DNA-[protein]-cysteine S-methyltransferase [Thiocapsa roseopersicina]
MPQTLIETPIGSIAIHWVGETLTGVDLDPPTASADAGSETMPSAIRQQLTAYFEQTSAGFDLPVELVGTDFQQRVWAELRRIPSGETRTYGEIARQLGSAPRAVGQACRANPCPIVVPCHRVVAVNGLGGFSGDTSGRKLDVKRWLLAHEARKPRPRSEQAIESDPLPEHPRGLFHDAV